MSRSRPRPNTYKESCPSLVINVEEILYEVKAIEPVVDEWQSLVDEGRMNVGFPMAASETEDRLLEKSFIRTDMICEKKTSFEINKKLFDFDWIICSGENKY